MGKRRKDSGFTLIELMIVIAVIGILAVVLVPKMTSAKDSAKNAGVITNAKSVEAYIVANIDRLEKQDDVGQDAIVTFIENQFSKEADEPLENPFDKELDAIIVGTTTPASPSGGLVSVVVKKDLVNGGIVITGYDKSGEDEVYKNTIRTN